MSKPDDIPQDIWDIAEDIYDPAAWHIARAIMKAKADENEACAKLAEVERRTDLAIKHGYKPGWMAVSEEIAAAIRKRLSP